MAESIAPECTKLKLVYDTCFNAWYTNKFLKGKPDNECDALFQEYQKCALNAIEKKGIKLSDLKFEDSLFKDEAKTGSNP